MNELQSSEKIVQQMTENGAVEVNKATGDITIISAKPGEPVEIQISSDESFHMDDGVNSRVTAEHGNPAQKQAVKNANAEIRTRGQINPEAKQDTQKPRPEIAKPVKRQATVKQTASKPPKPSRLKFTVAEKVDPPSLSSAVKSAMPSGATLTVNNKSRLVFREKLNPLNGKLQYSSPISPERQAGRLFHREISKAEDGNIGIEAAHSSEKAGEVTARHIKDGYKNLSFRPQRAAFAVEAKTANANMSFISQRSMALNPALADGGVIQNNAYKRMLQKNYANAFRQGNLSGVKGTATRVRQAMTKTGDAVKNTVVKVVKHGKVIALTGGGLIAMILLFSGVFSLVAMFGGGMNTTIATSYTAEDGDILTTEADYTALEAELSARISNTESEYPGFDEYNYNLGEIGHDPFELASYLTAEYNSYTPGKAQSELQRLFDQQYSLTFTPVTETRYRTESRSGSYIDGDGVEQTYSYDVQVPYEYRIMNVSLVNNSLGAVALLNLDPEKSEMYMVYNDTLGNKPYLFGDNVYVAGNSGETDYTIPPEALSDERFAAMIAEAEKFIGYPYVWGGSSPSTSFDCSGYVCWVINHSGGNVGRTTAQGLFDKCTVVSPGDAKPGDLFFLTGTYGSAGAVSHVAIYVGGGYVIQAGNPIGYADITKSYYVNHFYAVGRL